ncbi:MAG: hypothetical protein K2N15_11420 [Lachnospiraceae bacterium]|nr:hypothetical protein [Lachnospiraceae bacterium]
MMDKKVCILAGNTGAKEYSLLEKYASKGCVIALMNKNKELGSKIKEELEKIYHVGVFFFHGDVENEEDKDIFFAAVEELYGWADHIICHND